MTVSDEQAVKKPRGRPFSSANQPARGPRPQEPEQDFGQAARRILADPRAQRALLAKARRGDLPAYTLRMLEEVAAPAPEPTAAERAAPTPAEVAAYLEASVPPFIQRLMYEHARGRLDDRGSPTTKRAPRPKAKAGAPAREADLEPDQPLAAARDRLAAEARARREDRSVAVVPDLSRVPDPQPSKEELRAMGRAPVDLHDHRDREHRAACRACRRTWRADGADPTRIRR